MENKYSCPNCGKELTEADVIRGICSNCHSIFNSLLQKEYSLETKKRESSGRHKEKTSIFIKFLKWTGTNATRVPPPPFTSSVFDAFFISFLLFAFGIGIFLWRIIRFPNGSLIASFGAFIGGIFPFFLWVEENTTRATYWMWTIKCPQCGYEGAPHRGLFGYSCPRCSWNHVIRLGWRRRE